MNTGAQKRNLCSAVIRNQQELMVLPSKFRPSGLGNWILCSLNHLEQQQLSKANVYGN